MAGCAGDGPPLRRGDPRPLPASPPLRRAARGGRGPRGRQSSLRRPPSRRASIRRRARGGDRPISGGRLRDRDGLRRSPGGDGGGPLGERRALARAGRAPHGARCADPDVPAPVRLSAAGRAARGAGRRRGAHRRGARTATGRRPAGRRATRESGDEPGRPGSSGLSHPLPHDRGTPARLPRLGGNGPEAAPGPRRDAPLLRALERQRPPVDSHAGGGGDGALRGGAGPGPGVSRSPASGGDRLHEGDDGGDQPRRPHVGAAGARPGGRDPPVRDGAPLEPGARGSCSPGSGSSGSGTCR